MNEGPSLLELPAPPRYRGGAFIWTLAIAIIGASLVFIAFDYRSKPITITERGAESRGRDANAARQGETVAERIDRARSRSQNAKGLYMTSVVAIDNGRAATRLRNTMMDILDRTEANALVIDIKETTGGLIITDRVRAFIQELHARNIWVIARQAVFKDDSQEKNHPEWYLRGAGGLLWRDRRGGSWLDPASPDVRRYQIEAAKSAIDAGFDEVQFDYIRFPSDGDIKSIIYPVYDGMMPKHEALRDFFRELHDSLKNQKPEIILSADLFGEVAIASGSGSAVGQRLEDIGDTFDYISLMVYPSHYYDGFAVGRDAGRALPALAYPYDAADRSRVAVSHPYEVVHRSMLIAADQLAGRIATTAPIAPPPESKREALRLRPWLQDFSLGVDTRRGISYGAAEVRAQIDGAEHAGVAGWLLWSPDNVYTESALKSETED